MEGDVHQRVCAHSNVAHILRKDSQIGLERAYLAKSLYILFITQTSKRRLCNDLFNSYAKVMQILKMEIHREAQAQEAAA